MPGTVRNVFNLKECIRVLITSSTCIFWVLTTHQAVLGTEHTAQNLHNCGPTDNKAQKENILCQMVITATHEIIAVKDVREVVCRFK